MLADQPWLLVAGSWKSSVMEFLTFQAVQNCTRSGRRIHYKWNDFFSHVQPVIWVGCALWQSRLPDGCPAISSDSHPPFQKGDAADGLCGFSSAVDLQSYLQTAPCPGTQSCHGQCWTLLRSLAEDPKTEKIPSEHPTFWVWSSKSYKPQPLCNSTTLKVLAGGSSRRICKMRARYYFIILWMKHT